MVYKRGTEVPLLSFSDKRGFTVYEFLIVTGIITTVILLLAPTISRITSAALRQRCAGNLRTLYQAFELYRQSNKGVFPYSRKGMRASILLLESYQPDLEKYIVCPASGEAGSYSYDPNHTERDGEVVIFGDSPGYDELRDRAGPSENHGDLGGFYLRVTGKIDFLYGCLYRRRIKYRKIPLVDNIFERDAVLRNADTFLQPLSD